MSTPPSWSEAELSALDQRMESASPRARLRWVFDAFDPERNVQRVATAAHADELLPDVALAGRLAGAPEERPERRAVDLPAAPVAEIGGVGDDHARRGVRTALGAHS